MKNISESYRLIKICIVASIVAAAFASACSRSEYQQTKDAFEENRSKFEAMLPQWSKLVEAKKEGFKEIPVQPLSGKMVLLGRTIDSMTKTDASASLHPRNADFYSSGFLASKPDEVATVIFIHQLADQFKLYEKNKVYSHDKYQVYLVDAKSGELKGSRELKVDEKFDPPNILKDTTTIAPDEKLKEFIRTLPFGK
ncbi:MAG: hypothetical protein QUS14_17750 [Pyrinomonadaceae bacterium]|nr:hypothetical protein [Pyrinomonadaceae bacterium]